MSPQLGSDCYGKSGVRVVKVSRKDGRHSVKDLSVSVSLEGEFEAAHTEGDNSRVVPTDTMKNTVYVLAKEHPLDHVEGFAAHLAGHFTKTYPQVRAATVRVDEDPWTRMEVGGAAHPHAFVAGCGERWGARARAGQDGTLTASLDNLLVMKTTESGFSGFHRDRLTTLRETDDRIFKTILSAEWTFGREAPDFNAVRATVRKTLLETFAVQHSLSVQQTLYAMGENILAAAADVARIRLVLPNRHCLLVDLSPFGMANENEIFHPVDEPYGLIEATISR